MLSLLANFSHASSELHRASSAPAATVDRVPRSAPNYVCNNTGGVAAWTPQRARGSSQIPLEYSLQTIDAPSQVEQHTASEATDVATGNWHNNQASTPPPQPVVVTKRVSGAEKSEGDCSSGDAEELRVSGDAEEVRVSRLTERSKQLLWKQRQMELDEDDDEDDDEEDEEDDEEDEEDEDEEDEDEDEEDEEDEEDDDVEAEYQAVQVNEAH